MLEARGVTIGAVEGVQGISWQELTIIGQSNHAGTTPMATAPRRRATRRPRSSAFVRRLAREMGGPQVATVGRARRSTPTWSTSFPAAGGDDRRPAQHRRGGAAPTPRPRCADFCSSSRAVEGVEIERRSLARFEPVTFDPDMVDDRRGDAKALGHSMRRLPSGAGHDAQMMARVCPAAMVFIPSARASATTPPSTPIPTTSRPVPTCCCRCC